jgi:hypothetical protein
VVETNGIMKGKCPGGMRELLQTISLAFSVAGLCYCAYYLFTPWIWSQNIPFHPADITPWVLEHTGDHDGVEIYALYILMFLNIVSSLALTDFIGRSTGKRTRNIIVALCVTVSFIYLAAIGFTPPVNIVKNDHLLIVGLLKSLFLMAIVFSFIAILFYLQRRSSRWTTTAVAIALAPVCFIATAHISRNDYSYIFAPTLRLMTGAPLRDIYFQYDLLPSLLALVWMKLGMELNTFQVLGQASYYATILGVFLLSRKLFQKKELALFLVAALILGRIYASPMDVVSFFQVTPLRLDLWLPLLAVVYWRGPYHWSAGLVCGLLILLLKNFGIIYSLAYIQLLITLFAVSYYDGERRDSPGQSLLYYAKRCWLPLAIIVLCCGASSFLFKNSEFGNYAGYYQKLGIGFIQIASNSFYWYVPPIFSLVLILLLRMRKSISPTYMVTGLLLTYCAIGNSIYFFGRSHEHNILNIAIVLLFLLIFLLDLTARFLDDGALTDTPPSFLRRHGVITVAVALIVVIIVSYSHNIQRKAVTQVQNALNSQLIYPLDEDLLSFRDYIKTLRAVTSNSDKVYFLGRSDFKFYYYGGYAPVGYCSPFLTWIFTKDLSRFLQGLLDKGYYLACTPEMKFLLTNLQYNYETLVGDTVVAARLTGQGSKP